ncbi:hypothetical protein CBP36_21060 (plasmid) [Acidovorax carolinensis]|uniref:Phospholipid/glycerol acyltransferase domain-containing protein n=1 Tax=Acidovorax carolinensis TaxID=553814 RepID=A0A240UKB3_9BURK|nr:hypothetical protein CBP36_21060 [Acidovorax carolinensis]
MCKMILRQLLRSVALRVMRVRVTYTAVACRLRQGQSIVCSNHVSLLDGLIVALSSPVPLTFGVDTDYSKRSIVASAGMSVLAWMGYGSVVPVDDRSPFGMRSLAKALERGESVMLFPEGSISEDGAPREDRPGVAWLARRSGVPIIRIRIQGAERSSFFAKSGTELWPSIEVHF